jgi:hypothetical protein
VRQDSCKGHWRIVRFLQKSSAGITPGASKGTQGNRGKGLASCEAIGRGLRMKDIAEIITPKHEYYDDTHFVWRRVPLFWVGDFVASHSHKIVLWKDIKE